MCLLQTLIILVPERRWLFMADNKNANVEELRRRKENDETLTPQEEKVLAEAEAKENASDK